MDGPPPPPPPHGEKPNTTQGEYRKSSDLPPGNYDIFVIPPHSSGSGFLYLPSLQCQRNSFIAGSASTLFVVLLWVTLSPIVRSWYISIIASGGGSAIAVVLIIAVGAAGWAFGTSQVGRGSGGNGNGPGGPGFGGAGAGAGPNQQSSSGPRADYSHGQQQYGGAGPQGNYAGGNGNAGGGPPPNNQYGGNQYNAGAGASAPPPPPPQNEQPKPSADSKPQSGADWEKAREETRRKEELRRKMEEFKRKREAEAREKQRQREREAMERELREKKEQFEKEMAAAREAAAKEARERAEREAAEARAKVQREAAEAREREERAAAEARAKAEKEAAEARAKAEREEAEAKARAEQARIRAERDAADAKAKAEQEAAEKEAAAKAAAKKEADAKFAALKEAAAKKYAEKKARDAQEAAAKEAAAKEATFKASSQRSAPAASAAPRTPSPKKPNPRAAASEADDAYSFRPYDRPRRPYAGTSGSSVYSESSYAPSQSTARTTPPPSTKGRYETKDPDKIVIRGVYQFTNAFLKNPVAQLVSGQNMVTDGLVLRITTEGLFIDDDVRGVPQREWDVKAWTMKLVEVWCPQCGAQKQPPKQTNSFFRRGTGEPTPEESDAYLVNYLKVCKNKCRLASAAGYADPNSLHVLRATIRDQEGRRYLFVLQETEGWKVGIGLQRLRRGTQVRALGVTNLPVNECRSALSNLGYV